MLQTSQFIYNFSASEMVMHVNGVVPCSDSAPMSTMSNGKYEGDDETSSRHYTEEPAFVNGGTSAHDDDNDVFGCYDVNSLLEDAPVDSVRQRTHVEREESTVDSQTPDIDQDDVSETVDLDFIDGQVQIHAHRIIAEFSPVFSL